MIHREYGFEPLGSTNLNLITPKKMHKFEKKKF